MVQAQISVANQQIRLQLDCEHCPSGSLLRLNDGLEARFSSPDCLLDLLEAFVGRRAWSAHRQEIEAALAPLIG